MQKGQEPLLLQERRSGLIMTEDWKKTALYKHLRTNETENKWIKNAWRI